MKRLFALKESSGHLFQAIPRSIGVLYFKTKEEAEGLMDEINSLRDADDKLSVTYGPDHPQHNPKKK